MNDLKPFQADTVELAGSNLIEASAGTGKTYSVAILVLRLIIEKEINVKEILMVTFTRAAVAELEERIRLFIRLAYKASLGEKIPDETIANIVSQNIKKIASDRVQKSLRNAVLYLDEISVLTIHSFCQQTLTEFAFETDQLFGAETLQDKKAVLADEINIFWREQVTTIPAELLIYLVNSGLSRDSIQGVVNEHLGGKKYFSYERGKSYSYCQEDHEKIIAELKEIRDKQESLVEEMQHYVEANDSRLRAGIAKNHHARNLLDQVKDSKQIVQIVQGKYGSTGYIKTIFAEILTHCETCDNLATDLAKKISQVISDINCQAINAAQTGLREYMQRNNLLTFDDLIFNLHRAVAKRENPRLVAALRKKYQAVFVDEFQDTDRWQYEIFHSIFGSGTILFYIGDPKQSIYAFRKADIHTYFKAGAEVQHRYTMDTNFRSAEKYIEAMNLFFEPVKDFDTFAFGTAEGIKYRRVHSPAGNKKGELTKAGSPVVPITVTETKSKEHLYDAVVAHIMELLSNPEYTIKERPIKAGDIGILVRAGKEGRNLKRALSRQGISAVNIDEQKILKSEDTRWLLYLLEAMIDISHEHINKALLSPFTGLGKNDIRKINLESAVGLFRGYRDIWTKDGVYAAMMTFIADFDVRRVLLASEGYHSPVVTSPGYSKTAGTGERVIANLYQLIELVHKIQNNKDFSPLELVSWLQRGMEGMEMTGDEFEQRVESDEDAIKIVTIHKSKGLEYNIVFAPFLDMVFYKEADLFSYRDPDSGEYISIEKEKATDKEQLIKEQAEQENRRLIYVAITRAVYSCYLFHSTHHTSNDSSLNAFLKVMDFSHPELIAKTLSGAASSHKAPNNLVGAGLASALVDQRASSHKAPNNLVGAG
ncbi:MAG: UvrD-helicase domain-containing protein, partial [Chitinophagaceae bacterium]